MQGKKLNMAVSSVLLAGLALPLMPIPGDGPTRINVVFHNEGMDRQQKFSTQVSRSLCHVVQVTMSYEDPDTGDYARVDCQDEYANP